MSEVEEKTLRAVILEKIPVLIFLVVFVVQLICTNVLQKLWKLVLSIAGISNKSNPIHILVTTSLLHSRVGGSSNQ